MQQHLLHCGRKIKIQAMYTVKNIETFSQLFLFIGQSCGHCGKKPMGRAAFDIWGQPVLFSGDGTPCTTDDRGYVSETALSRVGAVKKKQAKKYWILIENGVATPIRQAISGTAVIQPGMVGVSEYSRRASGWKSRSYVLQLEERTKSSKTN